MKAKMSATESKILEVEVEEQLNDVTKCSICFETFKEPKMLTCIHTFCKDCLQKYVENFPNSSTDEVPCPICRKKFQIPASGGIDGLQNNVFVEKLIDIRGNLSLSTGRNVCESCSDEDSSCSSSEQPDAEVFCTDCQLKLCKRCHQYHLKSKILKNHKLVKISDGLEIGVGYIKAGVSWFCPIHSTKISDVYCSTCKDTVCSVCFQENHKSHGGLPVEWASDDFQKAIENSIDSLLQNVLQLKQKTEKLNENKSILIQTFSDLETEINRRREELKAMVDAHSDSLLSELKTKQDAALKKMTIHGDEIETLMISIDSFKTYFQHLTTFGSASSLCKAVENLSRRADELQKQCDAEMQNTLEPPSLRLKAGMSRESVKSCIVNLIGEAQGPISYLAAPKSVTDIKFDSGSSGLIEELPPIVLILDNELFVTISSTVVGVYDLRNLAFKRKWSSYRLTKIKDVKSSEINKSIVILNETNTSSNVIEILLFDPNGVLISGWSVGNTAGQLSITPESNVLFTSTDQNQLREYTSSGKLLRTIQLTPNYNIVNPLHAMKLNSGLFLVSHSSNSVGRICIVDSNGRVLHSIEKLENAVQLNCPVCMEQDRHGNVIVADSGLCRLFVLGTNLKEVNANFYQTENPFMPERVVVDESNGRAFVTERNQQKTFLAKSFRFRVNVLTLGKN